MPKQFPRYSLVFATLRQRAVIACPHRASRTLRRARPSIRLPVPQHGCTRCDHGGGNEPAAPRTAEASSVASDGGERHGHRPRASRPVRRHGSDEFSDLGLSDVGKATLERNDLR